MKYIFKYEKVNKHHYLVKPKNSDRIIGEIIEDADGYFYFFLVDYNGGAFSSQILDEISTKLDKLNKTWNKKINEYFNKQTKS